MTIIHLQSEVHIELLNIQRIYRYICSPIFEQAYAIAKEEDLERLRELDSGFPMIKLASTSFQLNNNLK